MNVYLSERFLRKFFRYVYYHILPDANLWSGRASVFLVPICLVKIKNDVVVDCRCIEEILDTNFKLQKLRYVIQLAIGDGTDTSIEQAFIHLNTNLLEITDNPIAFPGERLKLLMSEWLLKNPRVADEVDGVCHFHPVNLPLGELDLRTMEKVAGVMVHFGKRKQIAILLAADPSLNYVEMAKGRVTDFIEYMMRHLINISLQAKVFYEGGGQETVNVLVRRKE